MGTEKRSSILSVALAALQLSELLLHRLHIHKKQSESESSVRFTKGKICSSFEISESFNSFNKAIMNTKENLN